MVRTFEKFIDESNRLTEADWVKYNQLAKSGKMRDEDNPIFVFSTTKTSLLRDMLSGKYNVMDLIKFELEKRI